LRSSEEITSAKYQKRKDVKKLDQKRKNFVRKAEKVRKEDTTVSKMGKNLFGRSQNRVDLISRNIRVS